VNDQYGSYDNRPDILIYPILTLDLVMNGHILHAT